MSSLRESTNTNAGFDHGDPSDTDDVRAHNYANEIVDRQWGSLGSALDFEYDAAGNTREKPLSSTSEFRYTHDAWNRLVKVEQVVSSTPTTITEQAFNGLHWADGAEAGHQPDRGRLGPGPAAVLRRLLAAGVRAQLQVLTLTARGLTAKEIGRELGCAERTVYTHRADITRRTDLHGKAAMTVFAVRAGHLKP